MLVRGGKGSPLAFLLNFAHGVNMSFIYIVSASVVGPSSELIVKMIEAKNKSDAKSIFEAYLVSRFDAAEHVIKDMIVSSLPELIQERLSINSDVKKVADALALLSN